MARSTRARKSTAKSAETESTKVEDAQEPDVEVVEQEEAVETQGIRVDPEPKYIVRVRIAPGVKWSSVQSAGHSFNRDWQEFPASDARIPEWESSGLLEVDKGK